MDSKVRRSSIPGGRRTDPKSRLFQTVFPEQVWINIETFIKNLMDLPLWADAGLSETLFGGKQVSSFWSAIFSTGRTPQGMQVLPKPINLNEMIVPKGVE